VSERPKTPAPYVLAALVLLEGVALVAIAIYLVVEIFVARTTSLSSSVALAVLALVGGAGLVLLARAIFQGRPWIRGATICWQILQVLVAVSILQARGSASVAVGVTLIVPAAVIIGLLFTPQVLEWTSRTREDRP
jgi:hypothetical protein